MNIIRKIINKIPVVNFYYPKLRAYIVRSRLQGAKTEDVFTDIFKKNRWGSEASASGPGSDLEQTKVVIKELTALFKAYQVSSFLDIPCGDFFWMKTVDLSGINYIGADIVKDLIHKNQQDYAKDGISFQHLNLITDKLPKVDVIFCRDCLVHLSFDNIHDALKNIVESEATYLLATTFINRTENVDILTGQWRPLNLQLAPFYLPQPVMIIDEKCEAGEGNYADKSLGLWKISDIKLALSNS